MEPNETKKVQKVKGRKKESKVDDW